MQKTYKQWENFWDSVRYESSGRIDNPSKPVNEYYWLHVKEILEEYSQGSAPLIGPSMIISNFFSFVKGHWNHHHRKEIVNTISWYNSPSGGLIAGDEEKKFFTVEYILASLKQKIEKENKTINPSGDLAAILSVIKNKTNIDFYELDHEQVIKDANKYQVDGELKSLEKLQGIRVFRN